MPIASVAPATIPGAPGAGGSAEGSNGTGTASLFAGILGLGTGAEPATPGLGGALAIPVLPELLLAADPEAGSGPAPTDVLSAAQIMAAAQVVPVTPVLAEAVALQLGIGPVAVTDAVSTAGTVPAALTQPVTQPVTGATVGSTAAAIAPSAVPTAPDAAAAALTPAPAPAVTDAAAPTATEVAPDRAPVVEGTPVTPNAGHAQPEGRREHTPGKQQPDPGVAATAPTGTAGSNAPVNATGPAAPLSSTVNRPEAPAQVTGQVFPEVSRVVSRGDGTRRITIKLSPEALGDVQVTLTVRNGDVHVRMHGSELAQQALRAGAPELQRLLEMTGASSSQVVVGDQGSSSDSGRQSGPQTDAQAADQQHPHDHRTAGTRDGDTSARDGVPGGPHPRSSTDQLATRGGMSIGTHTFAGVDVTM
jgi:flagellar hook-length control protein FliK